MATLGEPLERLLGDWTFEREIDNGVRVEGRARLTARDNGLFAYREDGRMQLPHGGSVAAYADYLFRQAPGGVLEMLFAETPPRLFQRFELTAGDDGLTGESRYLCVEDVYRSRLDLHADRTWSLRHAVTGPRKGYVSLTTFRRA